MKAEAAPVQSAPTHSIWRSALSTIGTRAIDIPSRYGFHLLVAWKLGLVDAGAFYIVFSVLTLVAGLGRLGIDKAMTKEVASALARGRPGQANAVIRSGMRTIASLSFSAAVLLAAIGPVLATKAFDSSRLAFPLVVAGATIIPLGISVGAAGALAGLQRVAASQMIYSWLWPALFCFLAMAFTLTLELALVLILIATSLAALLSVILLGRYRPRTASAPEQPVPPMLPLGWSLFTTEIVQLVLAGLPGLVLGIFAGEAAVGAYAMAWRLALVINLLVVAVAAMASPRFAHCAAREDQHELQRTAAQALGLILAMGLVPLVVLWVFAPSLLSLFGAEFVTATAELRLLLIGQAIVMLTATAPELLGMTGHQRAMQNVNTAAILLYVPLLCLLSWMAGGEGAALANIAVALVAGGGAIWLSEKRLRFTPLGALLGMLRNRFEMGRG